MVKPTTKPFDVNEIEQKTVETVDVLKQFGHLRKTAPKEFITDEIEPSTESIEEMMAKAVPNAEALLSDRQSTHGDFRTNARISQRLKNVFRSYDGWEHLDDVERESMDMIALKLGRVLAGRSLERQHWEDVEGYARLVVRECK